MVEGTLNFKGTIENHIKLFPGERMSLYAVDIRQRNNGLVTMEYTDVINPELLIESAENCKFTQNHRNELLYTRKFNNATISDTYYASKIKISLAKDCSFELLGNDINWSYIGGTYDGCIFSECSLADTYESAWPVVYTNCVFYGNNNYLGEDDGTTFSHVIKTKDQDFCGNAIINRTIEDNPNKWFRVQGGESANAYVEYSIAGNYWGTTNMSLINRQIMDFNINPSLADLNPEEILTEAPENVWPFVVSAGLLDSEGNEVDVIGNETVTFYVEFNRDMDMSIPLDVRFGSSYPYADYQVEGEYVSDRRWEGTTTLTTLIEAGYQFWSIDNGRAADNHALEICRDWGRFPFEIDTSSALAMVLQAEPTAEGIQLTWMQDDFSTLAGYNVYRADKDEDGFYQRLNPSIIPVGEETWFDDTVEPGKVYYYIFTVVKTDLTESEPSGKKMVMSKDTMSPIVYHTPVYKAYEGSNVVVSATATDNVALQNVTMHYRVGGGEWQSVEMSKLNDKYSAVISGNNVTLDGIEYYIAAFDGVSYTYKGSENEPYVIVIQENPGEQMMGDVNGDGRVTILDALKLLRAANNKEILDDEQFARADLNGDRRLSAAEALVILKYANGEIGSLAME